MSEGERCSSLLGEHLLTEERNGPMLHWLKKVDKKANYRKAKLTEWNTAVHSDSGSVPTLYQKIDHSVMPYRFTPCFEFDPPIHFTELTKSISNPYYVNLNWVLSSLAP